MKNSSSASKLTYTILSISVLTVMAGAAIAPALGIIKEHFSSYPDILIQLIVSMPALLIICTTFIFPTLCRLAKTRTLALVALFFYIVTGTGCFLAGNIWTVLILRGLLGVCVGVIMPLSTGLLAYYFPPQEQAKLMGLSAAMNQLGGVIATLLSGFLAGIAWNYSFLVYILGVIPFALVVANLPNEQLSSKNNRNTLESLVKFHPSVIGMLLVMILFFVYPTNFALTARQNPRLSIESITFIMVGLDAVAMVVGLFFGRIMKFILKQMKYVAPFCFMIGYVCLSMGYEIIWLLSGSAFIGIATGLGVPYLNTIASIKGGKDASTTVMPLLSAALYLGQFISPLIISPLSKLIGGDSSQYKIAILFALFYFLQTFLTRNFQSLPPEGKQ